MKQLTVPAMPYVNEGTYKPEWAASKAKNAAKLKALMKTATPHCTYTGSGTEVVVYKAKDGIADFYFVPAAVGDDPELIQYGVRVIRYDLSGKVMFKSCGQVSVWRNAGFGLTVGLPEWIFTHVLYPEYGHILSDSTQSPMGRRFWATRISEAIKAGKKVFAIECEVDGQKIRALEIVPVHSVADMAKYYATAQDYRGAFYRFAIT